MAEEIASGDLDTRQGCIQQQHVTLRTPPARHIIEKVRVNMLLGYLLWGLCGR